MTRTSKFLRVGHDVVERPETKVAEKKQVPYEIFVRELNESANSAISDLKLKGISPTEIFSSTFCMN